MGSSKKSNNLSLWLVFATALWIIHSKHQNSNTTQTSTSIPQRTNALRVEISPSNRENSNLVVSSDQKSISPAQSGFFTITFRNVLPESPRTSTLQFTYKPNIEKASFAELLFFLREQQIHNQDYVLDRNDCKHFAHQLYEQAIQKNIKAHFVAIEYADSPIGHAVTAFPTVDQGMVFVDFTPGKSESGPFQPSKRLIWLEEGKNYLDIPLDQMVMGFHNRFEDFNEYHEKHRQIASEASDLEQDASELKELSSRHKQEVREFQTKLATANRSSLTVEEARNLNEERDRINAQAAEINQLSQQLREEANNLKEEQESIGLPTSSQIVKAFWLYPNDALANNP